MARNTNFLLGFGERLTEPITGPRRNPGTKQLPYTIEEARRRLQPQVERVATEAADLPDSACPRDETVASVVLHPEFLAKSYYPGGLFQRVGLRAVGSRPTQIVPQAWAKKTDPTRSPTTEVFLAGKREAFANWADELEENLQQPEELVRLESLHLPQPNERIRHVSESAENRLLEVALHASESAASQYILAAFQDYLEELGIYGLFDKRIYAGGLCFLPVHAPAESVEDMARFSFLRVARELPTLRPIDPDPFVRGAVPGFRVNLPEQGPIDPELRVAVFDGGIANDELLPWATAIDCEDVGQAPQGYSDHGDAVTSALLFGNLHPDVAPSRPYSYVDHYRVIDDKVSDPLELFDVLARIQQVLSTRRYQFFSLSLGPDLPIEDDEVHVWTSVLDDYLSDGRTLATLAVGNNGDGDRASGNARIQVPSDCVNALAVGASDRVEAGWRRASYSAVGPGRSPGVVKPDIVTFGGSPLQPFHVLDSSDVTRPVCGTSFASPSAMRMALGIRAYLGSRLDPLALKALLIHCAEPLEHPRRDVGWGAIPHELEEIVTCGPGEARVLYQGELTPAKFLRAHLPFPDRELKGLVTIKATFCFASDVDPQDPGSYTRSGLDVWFRPHSEKFANDDTVHAKTRPFFRAGDFDTERELRTDAHKWETVLSNSIRMQARGLHEPVFDVHYNARSSGGPNTAADKVRYALVITVSAPRVNDLYDQVVRTYAGQLQALTPVVEIPLLGGQ